MHNDYYVLSQSQRIKNQGSQTTSELLPLRKSLALIALIVGLCTATALFTSRFLCKENQIMLFFIGIAYIATRCSMRMAIVACILSVVCFSFFVVPPAFSFTVEEPQYLFTFCIMFLVAVFICRLINVQMIAKQQMREQTKFLNLTSDAIIAWDSSKKEILYWNDGAEKMFGYARQEVLHSELQSLLKARYAKPIEEVIFEARSNGQWSGEVKYATKDGREITTASRWRCKANAPHSAIIIEFATDISLKKQAERRVNEFYSTVSHELRTPLTIIRGNIELLRNGLVSPSSPQAVTMLEIASEQCLKMTGLVNDILDLQKIEAGLLKLKISSNSLDSIISHVVQDFDNLAASREVEIISFKAEDSTVDVDSRRIAQVITNYISNAIKFSPRGTVIKIITARKKHAFRVSVIDNGPGIAAADLPKLFSKFQQVDSSDSRNFNGTGLGLAISKAIVEQHKGSVGVESTLGSGSEFWFEIPFSEHVEKPISFAFHNREKCV